LEEWASISNGNCLDCVEKKFNGANFFRENLQAKGKSGTEFLYARSNTANIIQETYSKKLSDEWFLVVGRIEMKKEEKTNEVKVHFGCGNSVQHSRIFKMPESSFSQLFEGKHISSLWAKLKIEKLEKNRQSEKRKSEIIEIAKKFNLVSRYTSLIVLEKLEDYLKYKITPPLSLEHIRAKYLDLQDLEEKSKNAKIEERIKRTYTLYLRYEYISNPFGI